jgi:hypothetical protein
MESDMHQYDDFLKRRRELSPPPQAAENLERAVMARVLSSRPRRLARLTWAAVSLTASLIVIIGTLVLQRESTTSPARHNPVFEESIVIVDDNLICIWLEPLANSPREAVR